MTTEKLGARDLIFRPVDRFRLIKRVYELGLYRGNFDGGFAPLKKPIYESPPEKVNQKSEKGRIKKELRKIGRKILSKKNTQQCFRVDNYGEIEFSPQNIREAFRGRHKKKRKFEDVERIGDEFCFKPTKKTTGVDFVTIEQGKHGFDVFVESKKTETDEVLGRPASLLLGRIAGIVNHKTCPDRPSWVAFNEVHLGGLEEFRFFGQLDYFKFTTENFIKLNKLWSEKGGYVYNPRTPDLRVAVRTRVSLSNTKIPSGRTSLEEALIKNGSEYWIIAAVQEVNTLLPEQHPATNFFIKPVNYSTNS